MYALNVKIKKLLQEVQTQTRAKQIICWINDTTNKRKNQIKRRKNNVYKKRDTTRY